MCNRHNKESILIGIPSKNEEKHIADVVKACKSYGDVFVLNNGSTDNTEQLAREAGAEVTTYEWSGYGKALREIFKHARDNDYDILMTIDGDGQHNPSEIPNFLTAIKTCDVAIGNRFLNKNDDTPFYRKAVIYAFNNILGLKDSQCGFRAYNRKAIELMKFAEDDMGASLEILYRAFSANLIVSEVACTVKYENSNQPIKVFKQGMNLVETLFWSTVWTRPYTFLGIPTLILFVVAIASGLFALEIYIKQQYLIPNYVLICGMSILGAMLLVVFAFFITIQRRVIKELSAE